MRHLIGLRVLIGAVLVTGGLFGSQAIRSASASTAPGLKGEVMLIAFRYKSIQANVRRELEAASMPGQPARANMTALRGWQVPDYLRLTSKAFEAEKIAVLGRHQGVTLVKDFSLLPVALVRVAGTDVAATLAADPLVASIGPDNSTTLPARSHQVSAGMAATPADLKLIDDQQAQASGDLGEGTAVAVLDNGTDYTNPAKGKNKYFGDCPNAGATNCSVLAYNDFATPPAKGLSFDGHGTNVAAQVLKVAPLTKLIIGNVFHLEADGKAHASDGDIMAGLQWVLTEEMASAAQYSVRAVNLSLGVPFSYNTTACTGSPFTGVFSQLLTVNVQPVVAAGNTAYDGTAFTSGVASPACTPGALVVGAVYDQHIKNATWNQAIGTRTSDCADNNTSPGEITCFTQGGPLLGILAPGVYERAAGITDTGTSQATPLVSGAIAALASGAPGETAESITASILATGKTVTDPRTSLTVPMLDVFAAEKQNYGGAIIRSGNVGLGVTQWGDLNVRNQAPSSQGTTNYGLRYLPTGNEFAGPGCPCEGWGVAVTGTSLDGYADESTGDAGQTLVLFSHTATTAVSTVNIGTALQVINSYSPVKGVPDLFQDRVTIKNISKMTLAGIVYRRLVDWDMEPTAFNEYVTIEGYGNSPHLVTTTNDGFDSADPLSPSSDLGATGNFVRYGPIDQGAQFDFDFGSLHAGKTIKFTEYYGAAESEAQAYLDLAKVKAEAYSLGEPSSSSDGTPNTAILGFAGIGGKRLTFPPSAAGAAK